MAKQKVSKSGRLRAQIAALKIEAIEAERAERQARQRTVSRAAVRAGVADLGLSFGALVREFGEIVTRHGGPDLIPQPSTRAAQGDDDLDGAEHGH